MVTVVIDRAIVRVSVDREVFEYLSARREMRRLKEHIRSLQRSLMLGHGWTFHAPGSEGWRTAIDKWGQRGREKNGRDITNWCLKEYATREFFEDPKSGEVHTSFSYAWGICERRILKGAEPLEGDE